MATQNTRRKRNPFKEPVCNTHGDCFANKGGRCICLNDNDFGRRDCPFYKPRNTGITTDNTTGFEEAANG